ncbi:metallophosphoesterase [Pseudoalteromonas sp. TAE56]|uniref:metallophosphoesterase n=1 Tax=Pseudoalteromonas sp. TAE56 TaxID=1938596 RepID=UPI0004207C72|nr:metallophosphoesterase [Pseudoalteromonas sp. TAE56]
MDIGINAIQAVSSKQAIFINDERRVFVIGDLDGDLQALKNALNNVSFNPERDTLFCLGDFVDRGDKTYDLFTYLQAIRACMILGNHEHLMLESLLSNDEAAFKLWTDNGGNWHKLVSSEKLDVMCDELLTKPLSIVLEYCGYKIGLSHTFAQSWDWENYPDDKSMIVQSLLWDREVVKQNKVVKSHGVDFSIHGHNSTKAPFWVDNSYHIDTNYLGGKPTLSELSEVIASLNKSNAI